MGLSFLSKPGVTGTSYLKDFGGTGMGAVYNDPDFRQAETTLRRRVRPQLADFRYRLRNQGLSALDAEKATAGANIQSQNMFGDLVSDQLAYQQARAEARRARKKGFLGNILGTALNLIPGIAQARALGRLATGASSGSGFTVQNPYGDLYNRQNQPLSMYGDQDYEYYQGY